MKCSGESQPKSLLIHLGGMSCEDTGSWRGTCCAWRCEQWCDGVGKESTECLSLACGQKHSKLCYRKWQNSAQRLKIMPVVKGELGLGGSGVQQILFQLNHRPQTTAFVFQRRTQVAARTGERRRKQSEERWGVEALTNRVKSWVLVMGGVRGFLSKIPVKLYRSVLTQRGPSALFWGFFRDSCHQPPPPTSLLLPREGGGGHREL